MTGFDIKNGQCTWFAVMAMKQGTEEHKNIVKIYYGKNGNHKYC